jgi:hypothetical protein
MHPDTPLFRPDVPPQPSLADQPAATLDAAEMLPLLEHVLSHWMLNRPSWCRHCPPPPEPPCAN